MLDFIFNLVVSVVVLVVYGGGSDSGGCGSGILPLVTVTPAHIFFHLKKNKMRNTPYDYSHCFMIL